jgi:hypothetical protein
MREDKKMRERFGILDAYRSFDYPMDLRGMLS